jgi:hypothetical protein
MPIPGALTPGRHDVGEEDSEGLLALPSIVELPGDPRLRVGGGATAINAVDHAHLQDASEGLAVQRATTKTGKRLGA